MDVTKRTPFVAGNWKMNLTREAAAELIAEMKPLLAGSFCETALCVPFTDLEAVWEALAGSGIRLGAQNCHWAPSGAFTGEISAEMLAEQGVTYVIIGHSERRQYFGETDQTVNSRCKAVLGSGMRVILCVGETLAEREANEMEAVVRRQMTGALEGITAGQLGDMVVAYEPVWAIGTGRTATVEQAGEACGLIRTIISERYGAGAADGLRIQYGGSMNAKNAAELLRQPDIDGGLIGGASLKAADFAQIVAAARA